MHRAQWWWRWVFIVGICCLGLIAWGGCEPEPITTIVETTIILDAGNTEDLPTVTRAPAPVPTSTPKPAPTSTPVAVATVPVIIIVITPVPTAAP